MKHRVFRMLATCLLLLAAVPANALATPSYSGWKLAASINGLSYYGRTSIEMMTFGPCSGVYEYVGYFSGSTWVPYLLPPGYLMAYVVLMENGSVAAYYGGTNTGTMSDLTLTHSKPGVLGVAYSTYGYAAGYNPSTGNYEGAYLIQSPILYFHHYASNSLTSGYIPNEYDLNNIECLIYKTTPDMETYGSLEVANITGINPDWILAQAANGCTGYIDADDFLRFMPKNPADAIANFSVEHVRSIPVYAEPGGGEVIGQLDMYYGGLSE